MSKEIDSCVQYLVRIIDENDADDIESYVEDAARGFRLDANELHEAVLKAIKKRKVPQSMGTICYVLERQGFDRAGVWSLVSIHSSKTDAEDRIPRLVGIENTLRVPCGMKPIRVEDFRVRIEEVR